MSPTKEILCKQSQTKTKSQNLSDWLQFSSTNGQINTIRTGNHVYWYNLPYAWSKVRQFQTNCSGTGQAGSQLLCHGALQLRDLCFQVHIWAALALSTPACLLAVLPFTHNNIYDTFWIGHFCCVCPRIMHRMFHLQFVWIPLMNGCGWYWLYILIRWIGWRLFSIWVFTQDSFCTMMLNWTTQMLVKRTMPQNNETILSICSVQTFYSLHRLTCDQLRYPISLFLHQLHWVGEWMHVKRFCVVQTELPQSASCEILPWPRVRQVERRWSRDIADLLLFQM